MLTSGVSQPPTPCHNDFMIFPPTTKHANSIHELRMVYSSIFNDLNKRAMALQTRELTLQIWHLNWNEQPKSLWYPYACCLQARSILLMGSANRGEKVHYWRISQGSPPEQEGGKENFSIKVICQKKSPGVHSGWFEGFCDHAMYDRIIFRESPNTNFVTPCRTKGVFVRGS